MSNRGRTNDDGKCRFHPSIQLYLLTRKGKWLQIVKECPLCSADKISSKSNSLLTSPQMSSTFNEQKDGDELPSSASSTKGTKSSSPTSVVIPMTDDRIESAKQMIPLVPFLTTALIESTLTQTSSSPQLFLPSKSMVNRHDADFVESKLVVCRMNDEVCYVNRQTECLRAAHINDLIREVKSMQLITRPISQDIASTTKSSFSNSQDTASTTKSSFSRSDDDNSHTRSNSAPVSSIRRLHSNGSDTDSSAPTLLSSYSSYSTSQDDSDCESSFGSCDTLGQCIYHPNIQLKTRITCEGLKTGKWKTVAASCPECARELGQRNILNSLTSSEKDLMKRLLSSCEVDRSDRTDSSQNRRVSFAERDDIITFWL